MKDKFFILVIFILLGLIFSLRIHNKLRNKSIEINNLTIKNQKLVNEINAYRLTSIKNNDLYLERDADLSACLVDLEDCHNEIPILRCK